MKSALVWLAVVVCWAANSTPVSAASGCGCGSYMAVLHPAVPQLLIMDCPWGTEAVMVTIETATPGIHHCDCVEGQQNTSCRYPIEDLGQGSKAIAMQSGGCRWRDMDGDLWCFDVTCSQESGDPIPVEPMI